MKWNKMNWIAQTILKTITIMTIITIVILVIIKIIITIIKIRIMITVSQNN